MPTDAEVRREFEALVEQYLGPAQTKMEVHPIEKKPAPVPVKPAVQQRAPERVPQADETTRQEKAMWTAYREEERKRLVRTLQAVLIKRARGNALRAEEEQERLVRTLWAVLLMKTSSPQEPVQEHTPQINEVRRQEDAMWAAYHEEEAKRQKQMAWDEYTGAEDGMDESDEEDSAEFDDDIDFDLEEDEEDEEDEDSVIDNTDLSYTDSNYPICIRLNDRNERRNYLKMSEEVLRKKFERGMELLDDEDEEPLEQLVSEVFQDGFQKTIYVRNLSFDSLGGNEIKVLGIRPEIYPGDFLSEMLSEGQSLIFKGHLHGREFLVDSIFDVSDTECLDYEVECTVVPYDAPERVRRNFLYDVLDQTQSIVRYTAENLTEWKDYLNWKKELARRQVYGCKYFNITVDERKNRLVFWLVCESEEYFRAFKKYLHRDIQAFNNDYSSDEWIFNLAQTESRDRRRRYNQGVELGRYRGVVKEY